MTLLGRDRELALLDARLAAVRAGRPFALVVRGEPGIGKTALLIEVVRRAAGFTVLGTRGIEAAAPLPFRALRTLVAPLLDLRATLPPAQALALGTALDLEPPTPHDRFAVPAALLGLLQAAAQRGPVLVVADDAQWLDGASRDALRFVARRLPDAPIGIIAAGRAASTPADGFDVRGLDVLDVPPLDRGPARALLQRAAPDVPAGVAEELLDAADGNPLALLETPRLLSPEERAGRTPLIEPPRPGEELEAAFAREVGTLPDATRRALTVAAAMESGPVRLLLDALGRVGLDEGTLAPAERAGTLTLGDGELAFRHPLIRAAAYHAASEEERRAAHEALAEVVGDARLRAWYLAAAAHREDAAVAAELESAAREARARGGPVEAGAAFARAAELCTEAAERGRLRLEAAQDLAVAGRLDRAAALLDDAEREAGPEHRLAVLRLRGNLDVRRGNPTAAHDGLIAEAERQLAAGEPRLACDLALEAIVAGTMIADGPAQRRTVDLAVRAGRLVGGGHELLSDSVAAEFLVVEGRAAEAHARKAALDERLALMDPIVGQELLGLVVQGWVWLGDLDRAERVVDRLLAAYEEAGALGRAPYPLNVRAQIAFRRGRWEQALADAADSVRLARDTSQDTILAFNLTTLGRLEAALGRDTEAHAHLDEAAAIIEREGALGHAAHAEAALGFTEVSAGRPEWAIAALERAAQLERRGGMHNPAVLMSAGDLVEALVATGRREDALALIEDLEGRGDADGLPWAHIAALRGRVLLDDGDGVDALAARVLGWHDRLDAPFERARTDLVIGERLRRARRRSAAREPLGRALAAFTLLGAEPWANRARRELEASGGRDDEAGPSRLDALGEDERRIALLVSRGMTNREVGEALFLSPKTIERRLGAIYRKVGVRSRTELARLVTGPVS